MDKTSKITLASIIAFVAIALTFFAYVPSHVEADNSAPKTTATTTGKAFGQLVRDSFTVGDYPVTDARDLEILRVNIYDFAVFENTPKSDYHWVFVIQKGSLRRGGDKIFFRDTHGKSQMIDINKMNDVEIDVAPVLESDDMSHYLKIHALG